MAEPNPRQIMTCPYNKSHQIEHYKLHNHLQKCRKQYPDCKKETCPFDATHVVNDVELDYVSNYKSKLKKVVADINADATATGGGPPQSSNLSELDRRFLALLGQGFGQAAPQVRVQLFPEYHVTTCPKRVMLDTQMYIMDDDYRPVVEVQNNTPVVETEENWDDNRTTSYVPSAAAKPAHVIMKVKGATRSERRKARMEGVKTFRPLEPQ